MQRAVSLRSLMRGNVLVLTVSRVLWSMSDTVVYPYLSLYILALGGDKPLIGLVNALGTVAASLLYPIGGYIADKAGRAKLVGLATLLYTSSFVVLAMAPSWEWLAVGIMYQQAVLFYMPAMNAIMADSIPVGARGRIYALTIAVPEAVRILTPYIGGWLIAMMTLQPAMRLGYTMSFAIGMVVAYIRLHYLKETISSEERVGRDVPKLFKEGYRNVFTSIRWVFDHLRGYAAIAILLAAVGSIVMPFWVVYANEVVGLSAYDWGVVLLLGGVVKTAMSLVIGSLVDRVGPRKCMMVAFALSIPVMALFTAATSFAQIVLIYIVLVIASAFLWISSSVFLADTIPRPIRGRVMAGIGQGMGVGVTGGGYSSGFLIFIPMSLGSLAGGLIYTLNPAYPWFIQSVVLGVALLLSFLLIREPEKAEI